MYSTVDILAIVSDIEAEAALVDELAENTNESFNKSALIAQSIGLRRACYLITQKLLEEVKS